MVTERHKDDIAPPTIPNGTLRAESTRPVYDGFATIRSNSKRNRTVRNGTTTTQKPCHGCSPPMEPLWEENSQQTVVRRESKIPWWEVATRRSRYRSCPAFSQATIINALEQTVNDVTDKLERLASSPDLKGAEAEELRKSAAVLKKQSSAISQSVSSGYFSLERQASCDSVSSINSSNSNATHFSMNSVASRPQHTCNQDITIESVEEPKTKKRNWLRASFRKAFGKQNRKRMKNEENPPYNHNYNANQPSRYFSCTSLNRNRHTPISEMGSSQDLGKKNLKDSGVISRLHQLLMDRERSLADCRVELMAAQRQNQKNNDLITKLQAENTHLKEENCRLTEVVQSKFGSSSTIGTLTNSLSAVNINSSTGHYASLKISEGKRIKTLVVNSSLTSSENAMKVKPEELPSLLIGSVSVLSKTSWEELDNLVAENFEDYCNRLDPGNGLGLGRESLYCYRLAETLRAEGIQKPDLLPYGYCVGDVNSLYLWLKGPEQKDAENLQGNVASASLHSGFPSSNLKQLLSNLQEHRRIVIVGPPNSGKSTLAKQLVKLYNESMGIHRDDAVTSFTVNGNNSLELSQKLTSRWPMSTFSQNEKRDSSSSIVIDDIHAANGVVETLQRCLPLSVCDGPLVIGTSQNSQSMLSRLETQCYFKIIHLSVQEEPVRGMLGRMLRRPLLETEESLGVALPVVHRTVEWLTRLWVHLNNLLSNSGLNSTIGPALLSECPLDQEKARNWFTQQWNEILIPKIRDILKKGVVGNWVDPKEWIISTYPWTSDPSALNHLLGVTDVEKKSKIPSPKIKLDLSQFKSSKITKTSSAIPVKSDRLSSIQPYSRNKNDKLLSKFQCEGNIYSVPIVNGKSSLSSFAVPNNTTEKKFSMDTFNPYSCNKEFLANS